MPEVVELPRQLVAGLRAEVDASTLGEFFGRAVAKAMAEVPKESITGPITEVVHHDDGEHFDVTIGFPVSTAPGGTGLDVAELPAGPALKEVHVGDYPGLRDAYARLEAALNERGRTRQLSWEVYLTGPADSRDPAAWRTEVFVPLD